MFFRSLNVVFCSPEQLFVFVCFCSEQCFFALFGKPPGVWAKFRSRRRRRRIKGKLWRRFTHFYGSFLVFWDMNYDGHRRRTWVTKFGQTVPKKGPLPTKKGFLRYGWLLQANCLFTTPTVCSVFVHQLNCLFVVSVKQLNNVFLVTFRCSN